jgi:hypothetical protein
MFVEDEDKKIIRLAKRKAYGECDKHQGHWDGNTALILLLPLIAVAFFGLIGTLNYGDSRFQEGRRAERETNYAVGYPTQPNVTKLVLDCYDKKSGMIHTELNLTPGVIVRIKPDESCMVSIQ